MKLRLRKEADVLTHNSLACPYKHDMLNSEQMNQTIGVEANERANMINNLI